jgi:predicted XRE-type DNA-binding protein
MTKNNPTDIDFEESSGNVYADLGLEDADELFTRAQIGFHIYKILVTTKAYWLRERKVDQERR